MNRRNRLTKTVDLQRVRRTGRSYAHPLVVLIACRNDLSVSRFGVLAGRSVGNAVRRNRAKRRLREAVRQFLPRINLGWDAILIARPGVTDVEWLRVFGAVETLLLRSGMVVD